MLTFDTKSESDTSFPYIWDFPWINAHCSLYPSPYLIWTWISTLYYYYLFFTHSAEMKPCHPNLLENPPWWPIFVYTQQYLKLNSTVAVRLHEYFTTITVPRHFTLLSNWFMISSSILVHFKTMNSHLPINLSPNCNTTSSSMNNKLRTANSSVTTNMYNDLPLPFKGLNFCHLNVELLTNKLDEIKLILSNRISSSKSIKSNLYLAFPKHS
jgi:hypothetical protein